MTKQKVQRMTIMQFAYQKAGWLTCPNSGIVYQKDAPKGCGACSPCILKAKKNG